MWLVTRIHSSTCVLAHKHTNVHTALQQWEERATVTNNSGATKVAGNLSNGTIKLQLSFFSFFFIADACIWVASTPLQLSDAEAAPSIHSVCAWLGLIYTLGTKMYSQG